MRFQIMSTVLFSGTLVKRKTTSNETNTYSSESWTLARIWLILLVASKESLTVYMFCVRGFKSSERDFPTEWWVLPVVSIIGRKEGVLLNVLWTLGTPCALANLAFCGRIFLKTSSFNSFLSLSFFRYLWIDD